MNPINASSSPTWFSARLGQIAYPDAWDLQLRLVEARQANRLERDTVLLLEHPPVFTLGKRGGRESLLVSEEMLAQRGIPIVQVERGGNITYHGPGQLVVYPIVHLAGLGIGVVDMVGRLEEIMIRTCRDFGVEAGRNALNRGTWVGMKKIGSIGIAVRRGVSFHGLALNVSPDLQPFCFIQPCGLQGIGVTSIAQESGSSVTLENAAEAAERNIEAVFGIRFEAIGAEQIDGIADSE
jgi:lipoyl(octanoyl) transferase